VGAVKNTLQKLCLSQRHI